MAKVTRGVSLQQLEQILTDYATLPIAQNDVTDLVSALNGKVSNTDFQAFLDVLDSQPSVRNAISYKATTAPTGTATEGELCLCDDGKIYEHTGGSWDAGEALAVGERYWHFLTGFDVSGDSGSYTPGPNFYIYEWDGETFSTYQVTFGTFACVEDLAKFYWYNGSIVTEFNSVSSAGNISSDTFDDIEATNVQDALEEINAKINDAPTEYQQLDIDLPLERMKCSEYIWTRNIDANSFNYSQYLATESKEGLELYYDICCTTGVYELLIVTTHYNNHGKLTVYLDDVQQGVIDTYNKSVYYNINNSVFLNVLTDGQHTLKFVFSKNARSSGYFVYMSKMVLKKIAIGYIFDWAHGRYSNHKGMSMTVVAGGALTRGANGSIKPFGEWFYQAGAAQNDELKSPDLTLPAGSYKVTCWTNKNYYIGIVSLYEGDNLIDTIDLYSFPTVLNYTFSKTFDLATITTTNIKTKIESKNASSSGYGFDAQCWQIEKLT